MVYAWKGFNYGADPNKVGKELEKIEKRDGEITKAAVVEAARPEGNLMHNLFTWDNDVAGEKWREYQAGQIIHALVIVPEGHSETKGRAFLNIEYGSQPGQKGRFINTVSALTNEDTKSIVLGNALNELEAFKTKYQTLDELAEIFDAIDNVKIKLRRE